MSAFVAFRRTSLRRCRAGNGVEARAERLLAGRLALLRWTEADLLARRFHQYRRPNLLELTLADDFVELSVIERLQGFGADVAQSVQVSEAAKNLVFLTIQNEHPVEGADGPELGFDGDPCFFNG